MLLKCNIKKNYIIPKKVAGYATDVRYYKKENNSKTIIWYVFMFILGWENMKTLRIIKKLIKM